MRNTFSLELGCTSEELLDILISKRLARKIKKVIAGQVYEVLAVDAETLERFRR
jgi:hypothetical protein